MVLWQRIKDLYKKISVSAKQTTTSTADGGTNVMTFTFGDGTSTALSVKNGSKGSDGAKGEKGDRGPVGETGPQGNSGITDASSKALINDAVTGGETSYLSAEVGKLGINFYDCTKNGKITHLTLQDAINSVPSTFQKPGLSILFSTDSNNMVECYKLTSKSWSTNPTDWFSLSYVNSLSQYLSDKANFTTFGMSTEHSSERDRVAITIKKGESFTLKTVDLTSGKSFVIQYYIKYSDGKTKPLDGFSGYEYTDSAEKDIVSIGVYIPQQSGYRKIYFEVVKKNAAVNYVNNLSQYLSDKANFTTFGMSTEHSSERDRVAITIKKGESFTLKTVDLTSGKSFVIQYYIKYSDGKTKPLDGFSGYEYTDSAEKDIVSIGVYIPQQSGYRKIYFEVVKKNAAVNYGRTGYVSFSMRSEHSSDCNRLLFKIPEGYYYTLYVKDGNSDDRIEVAVFPKYSDGSSEQIVVYTGQCYTFFASKSIDSLGLYVPAQSKTRIIYMEVNIIINNIPAYWNKHLRGKLPVILQNEEETSLSGDNFIFISDYHFEDNRGLSHLLIKEILKETSIKRVIFGGDTFNGSSYKNTALNMLREFKKRFSGMHLIGVRGNHDFNLNDGGSEGVRISDAEMYANISKQSDADIVRSINNVYFYQDIDNLKLRYIYLDTKKEDSNLYIDDAQLDWMGDRMTELSSDWSIVIIAHQIWQTFKYDYSPSGQKIIDKIQTLTIQAKIIAFIAGHTHLDMGRMNDLGFLEIATTCDARQESSQSTLTQESGTVNEQAFDVFSINLETKTIKTVRIGRGINREFSWK